MELQPLYVAENKWLSLGFQFTLKKWSYFTLLIACDRAHFEGCLYHFVIFHTFHRFTPMFQGMFTTCFTPGTRKDRKGNIIKKGQAGPGSFHNGTYSTFSIALWVPGRGECWKDFEMFWNLSFSWFVMMGNRIDMHKSSWTFLQESAF